MTDQATMTANERRTAIKALLRKVPKIKDIADRAVGKRDFSQMNMAELEAVARKANVDITTLAAPSKPGPVVTADNVVQLHPDAPAVNDADLDADVAQVMSHSLATMPDAIRALAIQARTPRVVEVERVVERIVQADPTSAADRANGSTHHTPGAVRITPRVVRSAKASEVFEVAHPALEKLTVHIMDDPDAPEVDPNYLFDAELLALTLWRMASDTPVMLSGPKGTGKTSFAEQIAARLGRYFALISFDRTTEIDALIGQIELADGATFWRDGALVAAMRRAGSIILLDEPDMAKAGALAGLHPVLANRSILITRTGERVACSPGVYFMAAANTTGHGDTTGQYVDRNLLDGAFRDRFGDILLVPFPNKPTEIRIVCSRTSIARAAAKILVEYAQASRAQADKVGDVSAGLGARRLIAWAGGLLSGIAPDSVFRSTVVNHYSKEEGEVLWQLYKQTVDLDKLTEAMSIEDAVFDAEQSSNQPDVL